MVACKSSESGGTGGGGAGGTGIAGTAGESGTGGTGVAGTAGESGTGGTGGAAGEAGTGGTGAGGTGGTGGAGGTNGITLGTNRVQANEVCQRLAELQCLAEESCCQNPAGKYATLEACISNQRSTCEINFKVAQIGADPEAGYSIDRAEDAFDNFELLTSTCDTNVVAWGTSADGFRQMMQGTKANNSLCQPTGASDVGAAFSCLVASGLTCVPGGEEPSTGTPLLWSCKARSGVGGKCYTDFNCIDGLRCAEPETFSECTNRKALNETCTYPLECESLFCEGNLCVAPSVEAAYCLGG